MLLCMLCLLAMCSCTNGGFFGKWMKCCQKHTGTHTHTVIHLGTQAMRGCTNEGFFDEWMKRRSDLVQATALAFAEREVLDASIRALDAPLPTGAGNGMCVCLCVRAHTSRHSWICPCVP
eukprot:1059372-Pelagomonas_calceolata.AAC.3